MLTEKIWVNNNIIHITDNVTKTPKHTITRDGIIALGVIFPKA